MLTPILITLAAVWIAGIVVTVTHLRRAPVGVEDEHGFHEVESSETRRLRRLAELRGQTSPATPFGVR